MPNASEPTLKLSDLPSSRLPALFLALLTVLTSGLISLISAFGLNASTTPASHPPTRVATVAKLAALMGGLHGSVVIGNSLRAGPLQAQPAYAYDLAINNGVRYPTAGPWTITAPLGTTTHMGPARTNAPSTLLPLAAEGEAGATEPGWGPGTPAAGQPPDEPTIAEILKGKLGSIQRAPLPSGSPSWSDITSMTLSEIRAGAQANLPGYRTILKLLTDSRFNK